jgi:hypothetical protein
VTPSGFLSCIDIQYVEYFVDRFVDLKAKSWANFTRIYSGKSGFIKVREKASIDLKISVLKRSCWDRRADGYYAEDIFQYCREKNSSR